MSDWNVRNLGGGNFRVTEAGGGGIGFILIFAVALVLVVPLSITFMFPFCWVPMVVMLWRQRRGEVVGKWFKVFAWYYLIAGGVVITAMIVYVMTHMGH